MCFWGSQRRAGDSGQPATPYQMAFNLCELSPLTCKIGLIISLTYPMELLRKNTDQRAWPRAGGQERAAILLSLNPGDRGVGGKHGSGIHQGGLMAENLVPRGAKGGV